VPHTVCGTIHHQWYLAGGLYSPDLNKNDFHFKFTEKVGKL